MKRLGVNIDHIATLRQVRGEVYPDPIFFLPDLALAQQITIHLREDRRHIQEDDLARLVSCCALPINLELALNQEVCDLALKYHPCTVTFVPEKRQELTTEGGLNLKAVFDELKKQIPKFKDSGIRISLFIDPDIKIIEACAQLQVEAVELHTGRYAKAFQKYLNSDLTPDNAYVQIFTHDEIQHELQLLIQTAQQAQQAGLEVVAGHGLHARNLPPLLKIDEVVEFNIGHAIVARALSIGLRATVAEYQMLINNIS